MSIRGETVDKQMEKEAHFGMIPILKSGRIYGFLDAFLVLSGYCIATWSYTQGVYLTTLVGFKQLLIGAFVGALVMLAIYQLPVILSVRYGIDIWVWLRTVFGQKGVKFVAIVILLINFPWYAVCADLFASSMTNLAKVMGITLPSQSHLFLAILCVVAGSFIALRGLKAITRTTRILVPLLLLVGAVVMYIGFTSVSWSGVWEYRPQNTGYADNLIPYIISIEANFAFVITLVGGMAGIPRLCKTERGGYWAGVLGQGISGSFFVILGAVMAIAMEQITGQVTDDPTIMLATLSVPALATASLLLVAFANIGTQAVGSYIYGVMVKSTFKSANYRIVVAILAFYIILFCIWGRIIEFFGSFLTISAAIYAPLAALLFVDFFFVRRQKLGLRSAFGLPGYKAYHYSYGFNVVGFACLLLGAAMSWLIYNPLLGEIYQPFLFSLTPTGFSFLATGILYLGLSYIKPLRRYLLADRLEITV